VVIEVIDVDLEVLDVAASGGGVTGKIRQLV
jgi:hypothetical protein